MCVVKREYGTGYTILGDSLITKMLRRAEKSVLSNQYHVYRNQPRNDKMSKTGMRSARNEQTVNSLHVLLLVRQLIAAPYMLLSRKKGI